MYKKNKAILSRILPQIRKEGIQNFENHSPVDGELIANIAKSDAIDIDIARSRDCSIGKL